MTVFFDPTKLSDLELEKKEDQLNLKLEWASRFGGGAMITSLQNILLAIETEKFERYARHTAKLSALAPSVIESDPDLAAIHKRGEEIKREETAANKIQITKINIQRTSTPIIEKKD